MKKQHKKINSLLIRILFRTLEMLLNITVFLLSVNKKQSHPTTHDTMKKLAMQDPTLFDSCIPSRNRSHER
jgi:hypothetical protein